MQAQTEEERSWIVTENLIGTLSNEMQRMVWAAAIPHWFNAEILAVMRPEVQINIDDLYLEIQKLAFVEVFPERGHNIHEQTRKLMLKHLWNENEAEYTAISERLVAFFEQRETEAFLQIEWLYHLTVVDREWRSSELFSLAQDWINNFRQAETESLLRSLNEQIDTARISTPAVAEIYYWNGRANARFYKTEKGYEFLQQALKAYREVGDRLGEANTLQAIGDVLQFLDRSNEALANYEQAIGIYREVGDRLGEANTLQAIGDVLQFLKRSNEALANYEQAIGIYREVGDRLGEANILHEFGQLQENSENSLVYFQQAQAIYVQIGDRYSQVRNLYFIAMKHESMGNLGLAIKILEESVQLSQTIEMPTLQEFIQEQLHRLLQSSPSKSIENPNNPTDH
jgi:tetratricopeptide (TPR) repeat protein